MSISWVHFLKISSSFVQLYLRRHEWRPKTPLQLVFVLCLYLLDETPSSALDLPPAQPLKPDIEKKEWDHFLYTHIIVSQYHQLNLVLILVTDERSYGMASKTGLIHFSNYFFFYWSVVFNAWTSHQWQLVYICFVIFLPGFDDDFENVTLLFLIMQCHTLLRHLVHFKILWL